MSHSHRPFARYAAPRCASAIALAVACMLAGCGSDGTSIPTTATTTGVTPPPSPPGTQTTASTAGTVTTVGKTVSDLGGAIAALPLPGLSPGVTQGAGGTVSALGTVIDHAADALSDGLGQIGASANPVGTTLTGLGSTVSATSGVAAGVAKTVDALGSGSLSALSPVTAPLAGALYTAANGINAGGMILANTMSSSAVQQVTQPLSNAITPLVVTLGQTTQTVGAATGLGQPLAAALAQIGGALQAAGTTVGGTASHPVVGDGGQLVSSLGATVTNAGGLVNRNGPNGAAPIPGLITSLVGSSNTAVASGGANSGASTSPLGGLGSLLGATTPAAGGAMATGANPLSAVTGTITSLSGAGTTGAAGTAGGTGLGAVLGTVLPLGKAQ